MVSDWSLWLYLIIIQIILASKLVEALGGGIWTAVVGDWDRSKIVNENTNTNATTNTNTNRWQLVHS